MLRSKTPATKDLKPLAHPQFHRCQNNDIELLPIFKKGTGLPVKEEMVYNFENFRNSPIRDLVDTHPLRMRYIPEENHKRESEFNFSNFDDFFSQTFYKPSKEEKFEVRVTKSDVAESYLKNLGKSLRNY